MNMGPHIKDAQQRVLAVYYKANEGYPVWVILAFLVQRTATILKSVSDVLACDVATREVAQVQIVQVFTWVCSLANAVNADLSKNLREHFPGLCPACGEAICDCKRGRLKERLSRDQLLVVESRLPEVNLQLMLGNIFPDNDLLSSVNHMVAEVGELSQEIARAGLRGTLPGLSRNRAFMLELADVTAHACAVATLLEINLAEGVLEYLDKGCPGCKGLPCSCPLSDIELKKVGSMRVSDGDSKPKSDRRRGPGEKGGPQTELKLK